MNTDLRAQLMALAEEGYRAFTMKLIPGCETVLGVRMPAVRKLARAYAAGDWRVFLATAPHDYHEELLVRGLVIAMAKMTLDERFEAMASFIPLITNWAVCDSFISTLRFKESDRARVLTFISPYISSENEYEVRFAAVMLLNHFSDAPYVGATLALLDTARHEGYYARMAVAWAVAECFASDSVATLEYLGKSALDDFTYNKALQKITESLRVEQETKVRIRAMKRK